MHLELSLILRAININIEHLSMISSPSMLQKWTKITPTETLYQSTGDGFVIFFFSSCICICFGLLEKLTCHNSNFKASQNENRFFS